MLRLSLIEIIIKGIPESFLIVLLFFIVSNVKVKKLPYLVIVFCNFTVTLVSREFDFSETTGTNNMLHTLLTVMIVAVLIILLCHVNVLRSILSMFVSILVLMLSEALSFVYLGFALGKEKTADIVNHINSREFHTQNAIAGIPSTVIYIFFIILIYYIMKYMNKRKENKKNSNVTKGI